jgi:hypothetical protein
MGNGRPAGGENVTRRWRRVPLEPTIERLVTAQRAEVQDWVSDRATAAPRMRKCGWLKVKSTGTS